MLQTSARLLRLLSLLQIRREWSGSDLAERLEVDVRTVRRDIDKLRNLGYPVNATTGTAGGYRLGAGAALPPLLLDDDEAVAVAVSLRTATNGPIAGIEDTSLRALTTLEQVLPSRLRRRVNALQSYTVPIPLRPGPTVDAAVLTTIASACRDNERLRFDYRDHNGNASLRVVEPHSMANWGRRWYLVAWDVDRTDWRTFRVDRIEPRTPTGPRFTPRELPDGADVATFVSARVSSAAWRFRARILMHASAEALSDRLKPYGALEPIDENSCVFATGADSLESLALYLGMTGVDFEVQEPPELVEHIRELGRRYTRASGTE
ncbi:helix-turn-helix transcriptional regulator [Allokutzneria albata]|uniref:Predicted DNA-binding transcriptional regulator YafY, contains an HTH and WYL domains n=1 Tax=Allokutzneria albata TaxID=211114 RepID=A0A1G9R2S8_ALLAB|nr:YafY family protein [Allokutzneria albata]SDM17523.1 Predicted DNA-binding transcriptional regulator YafY, contains an HTH and WYL domains [Allokutzneria albata]